ncbi:GspE/PulE family protein [Sessilibacter corallicola]|uniref:ATPase, T2SS/T4P/T4SS family n=1 Tax=Sessilibacter corallicola TaxID=2904075 RepID=A0ABQ0AAQ0_9GAMM
MSINEATLVNALVHANLLKPEDVAQAKRVARHDRLSLSEIIGRDYRIARTVMYQAVAEQRKLNFLPLSKLSVDKDVLAKIPDQLLQRRLVLPVKRNEQLILAMADPDDHVAIDNFKRILNQSFSIALAEPVSIKSVLQKEIAITNPLGDQDPVELFDELMKEAFVCNASDIHLKPEKDELKVSLRVDGRLIPYPKLLNSDEAGLLVNRIKVLASLDISEQRMPQDGGFSYEISDWNLSAFDLRVATLPCRFGERVTLRILGQEAELLGIENLDLNPKIRTRLEELLNYPNGLVLVTGPTGSGKSTTLYAALREIDRNEYNVLTIEDPIEQVLEDATQVQVSMKVSFAQALRSFLRHDPDVILVGEVRDFDTAETALKASMTGHLVLSTLHTNNAIASVSRLQNLGCEHFMIASTLKLVIAQRLARRLCRKCKQKELLNAHLQNLFHVDHIYSAKGCPACMGTGYKGRIGLHEMFWVDQEMARLIASGVNEDEIRSSATDQLYTLWQDAIHKVVLGETSIEEIRPFQDLNSYSGSLVNNTDTLQIETGMSSIKEDIA